MAIGDGTAGRNSLRWEGFASNCAPAVGEGVIVLEQVGTSCRVLSASRGTNDVRVDSVEAIAVSTESILRTVDRLDVPGRPIVIVLEDVREQVVFAPRYQPLSILPELQGWTVDLRDGAQADCRHVLASAVSLGWSPTIEALDRHGYSMHAAYPRLGAVLAGLHFEDPSGPFLLLQLEETGAALIEVHEAGCVGIDIRPGRPTLARCVALLGDGCGEVYLCGGMDGIPLLAYELAMNAHAWVRLPRLACVAPELGRGEAGVLGAARHALGFAAPDAVACIPLTDRERLP